MALRFLLDENLRGPLWSALVRHNALQRGMPIDVLRVGDVNGLPLSTPDETILHWCQQEQRILISVDYDTMLNHLAKHIAAGNDSPGVLLLRPGRSLEEIVRWIEMIAHAGQADDYLNRVIHVP